jgi:hypothetical protein
VAAASWVGRGAAYEEIEECRKRYAGGGPGD